MAPFFDLMKHPIIFNTPRRLTPFSGWIEHIPFGMFLVDLLKPALIVELGTEYGDSYCAFCQAVQELHLDSRCYAVDTWQGDPQAGFYGPEVLANLRAHHDPLYGNVSCLIQSTFDQALDGFSAGTIDLLHIDGYHQHDSVRHDFDAWLPKLSCAGIVLLHDINVRDSGFGVWKLWEQLKANYPALEFVHGHGLGVLAIGQRQCKVFQDLLDVASDREAWGTVQKFFFHAGQKLTLLAQHAEIQKQIVQVRNRGQSVLEAEQAKHNQAVVEQHGIIEGFRLQRVRLEHQLTQQDEALKECQAALEGSKRCVQDLETQLGQAKEQQKVDKCAQVAAVISAGYGYFDNGVRIPASAGRMLLNLGEQALKFGDPLNTAGNSFYKWLNEGVDAELVPSRVISRFWYETYRVRPDLLQAFPDVLGADRNGFLEWIRDPGAQEQMVDHCFIPRLVGNTADDKTGVRSSQLFGVNVAGYFSSEKGVGEGVRSDIRCLEAARVPYVLNSVTDPGSANSDAMFSEFSPDNPYGINLIHVNADAISEFLRSKGKKYVSDRYNIGYWAWELTTFPAEWRMAFQFLDEVWVPSHFAQDAVSRVSPVPVIRVPHCIAPPPPVKNYGRAHFGLPADKFLFLFIFDFHSYFERKNPLALIKAFRTAFGAQDDVCLVLKCSRPESCPDGLEAMQKAAHGANVKIIDRVLHREEINGLLDLCDCYVSLHRSEGFGLTMAEAMSFGKPVIGTNYSGNTDFMTSQNSYLVRYEPIEIEQDHGPYKKGNVWADPSIEHAAELMRLVYENPEAARKVGQRAAQDMRQTLFPQAVGELVGQRLRLIDKRLRKFAGSKRLALAPEETSVPVTAQIMQPIDPAKRASYEALIGRVREAARTRLPAEAVVAVVNKGDKALLSLDGPRGWHFPQDQTGDYVGFHPADSAAAVEMLEAARAKGAHFVLFPETAFWWLDAYPGLRQHLDQHHRLVFRLDDTCIVYALAENQIKSAGKGSAQSSREAKPISCSIIIPVHNKAALTEQCLNTLLANPAKGVEWEIVVVDDASTDLTASVLANYGNRIRILTQVANSGFARACNRGAAASKGKYLVFLNNDTIPRTGWLDALVGYAQEHPTAGIVGSKLLFPDNTIQHAGVVICQDRLPRHIYTGFPSDHPAVNKSRAFPAVTGASMLVRRELFELAGGFDESFMNSFEDIDLCLRLRERGFETHYCQESILCHLESVSREGRRSEEMRNAEVFFGRWENRLVPDDLGYYIEDGLLSVHYKPLYPLPLSISPLLATIEGEDRAQSADRLLNRRAEQVIGLLKENIRLNVRVQEAELKASSSSKGSPPNGELPQSLPAEENSVSQELLTLRQMLHESHHQLLRRDEEIQATLAATLQHAPDRNGTVSNGAASKHLDYEDLIVEIRKVVNATLPKDAIVIVVSKGDPQLLKLGDRQTWHFPQADNGVYAGYYPADSAAAIAHLEALRAKGGAFLLFPANALWWLDHYADFKHHLERCYRKVVDEEQACRIYKLAKPAAAQSQSKGSRKGKRGHGKDSQRRKAKGRPSRPLGGDIGEN